jgi:AraC family transcriptional regulator
MGQQIAGRVQNIDAERLTPIGCARLVRSYWAEPIDRVSVAAEYHLELALLPRPDSQGSFPEYWGSQRFERFGEVFLVPARQALHVRSSCRQQHSIVCAFRPDAVKAWFEDELEWTDARLCASLDIASPHIRSSLFRLGEELRNPGFASDAMIEILAGQIAIDVARYCIGIGEYKISGGLCAWKLRLIDERLAEPGATPTLSELASACDLSIRHLTRAFRRSRGRSIGSCIIESRINQSKNLLASSASLKSIAYSMGFTSPSNFSTAFRRATGETPSEYRQRVSRATIRH